MSPPSQPPRELPPELPEWMLVAYVDGELDADELRRVEQHLVRSRASRELVMALRSESALLRDALQERPRAADVRRAAEPARGMAIGLGPTLIAVGTVTGVLGWLIEARMPSGWGWLNPTNWIGAYEMLFDTIFWIRDQAPALLQLFVAVAITASVSALLTFAVAALSRRITDPRLIGPLLLLALALPGPARAIDLRHDEVVTVAPGEVVNETLVISADSVHIDGVVNGDLIVLAEQLAIKGEVRGDVFALAVSLELVGSVSGSLHIVSERTSLRGPTGSDLYAASEYFLLGGNASVARDVSLMVRDASVEGAVNRNLFAAGDRMEIRGNVARNASFRGRRLLLYDGARIEGDLDAAVAKGEKVEIASGASIGGEFTESVHDHMAKRHSKWLTTAFYVRLFVILTSAFLVGLALHALIPGIFRSALVTSPDFFRALGVGFVVLVVTPLALLIAFVTVVGIPIAVIGLWIYLTSLFAALILVSALVGRAILKRGEAETTSQFGMTLLVGLLVVGIAMSIPWVGVLLRLVVVLTGLGLLATALVELWRGEGRAPAY